MELGLGEYLKERDKRWAGRKIELIDPIADTEGRSGTARTKGEELDEKNERALPNCGPLAALRGCSAMRLISRKGKCRR